MLNEPLPRRHARFEENVPSAIFHHLERIVFKDALAHLLQRLYEVCVGDAAVRRARVPMLRAREQRDAGAELNRRDAEARQHQQVESDIDKMRSSNVKNAKGEHRVVVAPQHILQNPLAVVDGHHRANLVDNKVG